MHHPLLRIVSILFAVVLFATACGSDAIDSVASTAGDAVDSAVEAVDEAMDDEEAMDEEAMDDDAESAIPAGSDVAQVSAVALGGTPLDRFDPSLAPDPAVGTPAPDITASFFDDTEVTVDMSDGTPRLVMFFAHWCPHCQAEVTELSARFAANGLPEDVELLAVSTAVDATSDNYPASDWFIAEGWPVPVVRDDEVSTLGAGYGLSGFPYVVAVDSSGNVVARVGGNIPEADFNNLLALAAS